MDRNSFIQQYVTVFLATHSAAHYADNCSRGWVGVDQPVEDALLLAEEAWGSIDEHIGKGVTS